MPAMPQSTCRPRSVATPPRRGATTASSRPGLVGRFVARRPDRRDTACTEAHHAVHIADLPCGSTRSSPTPKSGPMSLPKVPGGVGPGLGPARSTGAAGDPGHKRVPGRPRSGADRTLGVDRVSRPPLVPTRSGGAEQGAPAGGRVTRCLRGRRAGVTLGPPSPAGRPVGLERAGAPEGPVIATNLRASGCSRTATCRRGCSTPPPTRSGGSRRRAPAGCTAQPAPRC